MKRLFFLTLILAIFAAFSLTAGKLVIGQTALPTPAPTAAETIESEAAITSNSDQVSLKQQYIGQMEEYLQKQKSYAVAKDQYQRHQTLSSIEEAVVRTKQVMLARSQVLQTYLQLVKSSLAQAQGIEITQKQQALAYLDATLNQLKASHQNLQTISTREEVNQAAAAFDTQIDAIQNAAYYGLSLLSIGKLQSTYDQSQALEKAITQANFKPETLMEQSEQARALAETEELMKQVQQGLTAQWAELAEIQPQEEKYERFYQSLFDELTPVYARLSQLVSYLEELMTYGEK